MTPEEKNVFIADLVAAISTAPKKELTEDELVWVRLAIEAESRKIKFRDAVIEKSLSGLVWSGIIGLGYILLDFFKNHGFKLT